MNWGMVEIMTNLYVYQNECLCIFSFGVYSGVFSLKMNCNLATMNVVKII